MPVPTDMSDNSVTTGLSQRRSSIEERCFFWFIFKKHIAIMSPVNKHDIVKIEDCLRKYPVVIAYIFGSEAKETSGLLSDIDIALFVHEDINKAERFDLKLRLSSELSAAISRRVDLVILNDSPLRLSYEIIRHGKLIFCSDKSTRVDLEVNILSRYLDRRYYDKRHAELTLQKIASQGFSHR